MKRLVSQAVILLIGIISAGCGFAEAPVPKIQNPSPLTATSVPDPSPEASYSLLPTKKRYTTSTPTPIISFPSRVCEQSVCISAVEFPFQRPISPIGNLKVEASYRYGSTQNGQREVHHGVDFINKAGIPVLAAADGSVIFAGDDDQQSFAMMRNFYGKLIILKHQISGIAKPVYTVYGHLLKIQVEIGQNVRSGEQIGEVGLGGVAAGTHLHFEVRYGNNEYDATRNPELWFAPLLSTSGILTGNFFNQQHQSIFIENFVLEFLSGGTTVTRKMYYSTYEDSKMVGLFPWHESFGINDLPAGTYRLSFIYQHPVQLEFEINSGKVTFLNIMAH